MESVPTSSDYLARIRWVRMCMALLVLQDDFGVAREIAATMPRKGARW
ncbi:MULTISPECIES: hypothetical protein [unclassified Duganella]|nr:MULTISPECIES: hypothetical protein [unclassified Duganella]SDF81039.1 hypothetical protein SAMN05216320_1011392 [Duganella sp. OV458]SDI48359.1 hypothetical protein SAMN05428973_10123 [Duganella sp. OV510]